MNKKLKEILAKDPASLTAEEKAFLQGSAKELSAEVKAKFAVEDEEKDEDEEGEGEKAMDIEAVKKLVSKSIEDSLTAKTEKIAEMIAGKFMKGVKEQRAKAIAGEDNKKDEKADSVTRKFMAALMNGDRAAAKALTTSSTDLGSPDDAKAGLLIPTELLNEVLRIIPEYGVARVEMLYLPFSGPGNTRTIPTLGTSVTMNWTDEGGKKKSTQPKFAIVTQTLKKLTAIVPMTEEILEDSLINLTELVGKLIAEAVAKEVDIQFFNGTGSPFTGILNNGSINQVTEGTGDADDNLADELLRMQDATPAGAQAGAKYYLNRTWLSKIRKLKDQDGNYIYQAPAAGLPGTIWNKPYVTVEAMPTVAEVTQEGDPFILYGNLKQGAIYGDKQQIRVKLLDQATINDTDDSTSINLAEQDMIALRFVQRVGYVIALPAALTVLLKGAEDSPVV